MECRRITEDDRKLHTSLPQDIDFRATIIWIGPCRSVMMMMMKTIIMIMIMTIMMMIPADPGMTGMTPTGATPTSSRG